MTELQTFLAGQEAMYASALAGGALTADDRQRDNVREDALSAIAKDIPDPVEFAWFMHAPWCFWLTAAYRSSDPANSGCYRVRREHIRDLRAMGLVDSNGYLGAFGFAVYKTLMEHVG